MPFCLFCIIPIHDLYYLSSSTVALVCCNLSRRQVSLTVSLLGLFAGCKWTTYEGRRAVHGLIASYPGKDLDACKALCVKNYKCKGINFSGDQCLLQGHSLTAASGETTFHKKVCKGDCSAIAIPSRPVVVGHQSGRGLSWCSLGHHCCQRGVIRSSYPFAAL